LPVASVARARMVCLPTSVAAQSNDQSSLLGKGFDGHEAQPVAGGLVAVDDPTECKVAYLVVVGRPAGETVAHLIDKFLERRFAQSL